MSAALCAAETIHDRFVADHDELEAVFTRLLAAFEAGNREAVATAWSEFDDRLSRHLDAEEHFILPQLSATNPRAARAILEEHRYIRSRLAELGFGVDLHIVRLETARGFVAELRAHAQHEDEVLYRWADQHLPAREHGALDAALKPR
jgi:hemerythrin-like domain-containing protein